MQRFLKSRYKSRFFIFKSCGTLSPAVAPFRSSSPLVGRHCAPFFHAAAPFRSSSPLMGRHCAPRSVPSGTPSDPPLLRWPGNYDFCKTRKSRLHQAVPTINRTRDPSCPRHEQEWSIFRFLKTIHYEISVRP